MIKVCEFCGKEFPTKDKRKKYCTKECYHNSRKGISNSKIRVKCTYCGEEIERYPSQVLDTVFCSIECLKKYREENRITFKCEICGEEKTITKNDYDKSEHHYCSYECANKGQAIYYSRENHPMYGKHLSEETKKKISDTKINLNLRGENSPNYKCITVYCDYCGEKIELPPYRIYKSEHHYCSQECKSNHQKEILKGENNPFYNPELSEEDRERGRKIDGYKDFIKAVYKRDNWTCQCCGKKGGNIVAHHLNGYNWDKEHRTDIDNGITLCEEHHKEFHSIYGYGNNTKEQFEEFINNRDNESA